MMVAGAEAGGGGGKVTFARVTPDLFDMRTLDESIVNIAARVCMRPRETGFFYGGQVTSRGSDPGVARPDL